MNIQNIKENAELIAEQAAEVLKETDPAKKREAKTLLFDLMNEAGWWDHSAASTNWEGGL